MTTFERGLCNVKELKRIKTEEAARADISKSEMSLVYSSSNINESVTFIIDWSSILPISPFFLGLFADLKILNTVETFSDIQSNS